MELLTPEPLTSFWQLGGPRTRPELHALPLPVPRQAGLALSLAPLPSTPHSLQYLCASRNPSPSSGGGAGGVEEAEAERWEGVRMALLVSLGNVSLAPKKVCENQIPILNARNSGFTFFPFFPMDTCLLSSKQSFTIQACTRAPLVISCPTSSGPLLIWIP